MGACTKGRVLAHSRRLSSGALKPDSPMTWAVQDPGKPRPAFHSPHCFHAIASRGYRKIHADNRRGRQVAYRVATDLRTGSRDARVPPLTGGVFVFDRMSVTFQPLAAWAGGIPLQGHSVQHGADHGGPGKCHLSQQATAQSPDAGQPPRSPPRRGQDHRENQGGGNTGKSRSHALISTENGGLPAVSQGKLCCRVRIRLTDACQT
jgi:hypothetical protein